MKKENAFDGLLQFYMQATEKYKHYPPVCEKLKRRLPDRENFFKKFLKFTIQTMFLLVYINDRAGNDFYFNLNGQEVPYL